MSLHEIAIMDIRIKMHMIRDRISQKRIISICVLRGLAVDPAVVLLASFLSLAMIFVAIGGY